MSASCTRRTSWACLRLGPCRCFAHYWIDHVDKNTKLQTLAQSSALLVSSSQLVLPLASSGWRHQRNICLLVPTYLSVIHVLLPSNHPECKSLNIPRSASEGTSTYIS